MEVAGVIPGSLNDALTPETKKFIRVFDQAKKKLVSNQVLRHVCLLT